MIKKIENGLDNRVDASKNKSSDCGSIHSNECKSDTNQELNPKIYHFQVTQNSESSYECCRMC